MIRPSGRVVGGDREALLRRTTIGSLIRIVNDAPSQRKLNCSLAGTTSLRDHDEAADPFELFDAEIAPRLGDLDAAQLFTGLRRRYDRLLNEHLHPNRAARAVVPYRPQSLPARIPVVKRVPARRATLGDFHRLRGLTTDLRKAIRRVQADSVDESTPFYARQALGLLAAAAELIAELDELELPPAHRQELERHREELEAARPTIDRYLSQMEGGG